MKHVRVPIRELRDGRSTLCQSNADHGRREVRSPPPPHAVPSTAVRHSLASPLSPRRAELPHHQRTIAGDGDEPPVRRRDESGSSGSTSGGIARGPRCRAAGAVLEKDGGKLGRTCGRAWRGFATTIGPTHDAAVEHTRSACRSPLRASSIVGPVGDCVPSGAAVAAAAAAAKVSASPPSSGSATSWGARVGTVAAPTAGREHHDSGTPAAAAAAAAAHQASVTTHHAPARVTSSARLITRHHHHPLGVVSSALAHADSRVQGA